MKNIKTNNMKTKILGIALAILIVACHQDKQTQLVLTLKNSAML